MAEQIVRLSFPAKADYLLLARLALAGLARGVPLGEESLADLKLAVTEACGNVVRHAYASGEGSVGVVFVVGDEKLEMIVEDQGSGLSAGDVDRVLENGDSLADLEPFEGGMGMAIIRAVVDELDVHDGADGRGTVVRMTKYLTPASAE
jgi:serine/threonine-protein kinase RsbW